MENKSYGDRFQDEHNLKTNNMKQEEELRKSRLNSNDIGYRHGINAMVNLCHGLAKDAGWHDNPRETGTCLMLIVSEIAEAMEGDRKNLMDDHLTNRKMFEVELADAVIRIFDLAGREGIDLGGALVEKLIYNQQRPDHKKENREKEGGKKY